ncbi:MAG: hypothetical protein ABJA82_03260 [Myxococcales bacterium]
MKTTHSILFTLLLGAGCAHAPRPYTFTARSSGAEATVEKVAASLVRQGHPVSGVDRRSAQITTYWENTGYRYRETDDLEDETTVFLRYHVDVRPVNGQQQVTVSAEAQRCVPYRAVITKKEVLSTCINMDKLLVTHQRTVDELGRRLAASLVGPG